MTMNKRKSASKRPQEILEALAGMLQSSPGAKVTTAALAAQLGVSEAALYRHFPSKARMFEGLIDFIEESLFTRIRQILDEENHARERLYKILSLVLIFAERNPGMARIIAGDALTGENQRLRSRVSQLHDRLETQLKQVLRESEVSENLRTVLTTSASAEIILVLLEGKIRQFVRSDFNRLPTEHWRDQWQALSRNLFQAPLAPPEVNPSTL